MKKTAFLSIACMAAGLLSLGSCSNNKNMAATAKQFDRTWNVTAIDTLDLSGDMDNAPTLIFNWADKSVGGKTGCNSYFASFDIPEKGTIKFGNAAATKMYCIETMHIEKAFLDAFNKTTKYTISRKTLRFFDDNGQLLMEAQKN